MTDEHFIVIIFNIHRASNSPSFIIGTHLMLLTLPILAVYRTRVTHEPSKWPSSPRVSRAPNRYLGGHEFNSRRRLSIFLCPIRGGSRGGVEGVATPPLSSIFLLLCLILLKNKKKTININKINSRFYIMPSQLFWSLGNAAKGVLEGKI